MILIVALFVETSIACYVSDIADITTRKHGENLTEHVQLI